MKVLAGPDGKYQIHLEIQDKIMTCLTRFASEHKIKGGQITGIGAIKDVTLAYYNLEQKKYVNKKFNDGVYELIHLTGNITQRDGLAFIHAHISMAEHNFNTLSGHLMEATVAVVGEFFVTPLGAMPARKLDERVGLPAIDHLV